jgi:hypothetical protein
LVHHTGSLRIRLANPAAETHGEIWKPVTNFWTSGAAKLMQKPMLSTQRPDACNYFYHPASISGIPFRFEENIFKTGVVLKKSSIIRAKS